MSDIASKASEWFRVYIAIFTLSPGLAGAAVSIADFAAGPPTQRENASPMVMLVMSRDEQLFKKAYNDYTALDTNPGVDYTYTNTFDYYGYFASDYCYEYDTTAGMFKPSAQTTGHNCSSFTGARWSGNFLNWASMTRMDIVRRVLYGGARSSDPNTAAATSSHTVLERAMLPPDIHSFAKVYAGSDMGNYTPYNYSSVSLPAITLCNVSGVTIGNLGSGTATATYATGLSHALDTSTYPPLILVAKGNNTSPGSGKGFPNWAAGEGRQCGPGNNVRAPQSIDTAMNARVQVCVPGKDATDATRCRKYSNGNYKPVGLLQRYGESHSLRFGLMSGSYAKKDAGGVLRRNIGYFAGNNVADPSVITSDDEINLTTGQFAHDSDSQGGFAYPGIISTLNRFRISQYDFTQAQYEDCRPAGVSIADFKAASTNTTKCRDWGNPLAEAYLEALNYISGQTAPSALFNANDAPYITLPSPLPQLNTWVDPYSDIKNRCARCAIVVLSTGLNTFDADHFVSNITGLTQASLNTRTDMIGLAEGFFGKSYFIGSNGTTNDAQCTAKSYLGLSRFRGLCPEMPQQEGSYQLAGLAYFAHITDLRSVVGGSATDLNKQVVDTYDIQLAENVPQFTVPGTNLSIMPLCLANGGAGDRQCSLTNVVIQSDFTATRGSMEITWEDSQFGFDYDMDAIQQLDYCVGAACSPAITAGSVKVTVSKLYAAACDTMKLGYSIYGATAGNGSHMDVTVVHGGNCGGTEAVTAATPTVYVPAATASVQVLKNPLWHAAKWGGFDNSVGRDTITQIMQWDMLDVAGNKGADTLPDNYFPVSNPAFLEARLASVFQKLSAQVTSGTAAAVIANSSSGTGALYQAYYNSSFIDPLQRQMLWGGVLHAMFVDEYGRLREDLGAKGALEATTTDFIVRFSLQPDPAAPISGRKVVMYQRYTDPSLTGSTDFATLTAAGGLLLLENFGSIWNARNMLGSMTDVTTQRVYTSDAGDRRYIFTYLLKTPATGPAIKNATASGTNSVTDATFTDFTALSFPVPSGSSIDQKYLYFGLADPSITSNLVDYIRGKEFPSFRSRTVDYPDGSTGNALPWRLGDMVNSSPVVVGPPEGLYDSRYGDETYRSFKAQYANRREMIYVGANDGMVHAFNGGVWDAASSSLKTSAWTAGGYTGNSHALGAEMWGYVPMSLLPHLQWLAQSNYSHVCYVDGAPMTFDANIFAEDAVHKNGWGTVLVIGMRLGGGPFAVDLDGDGSTETTLRSSYMIFDITDPERPPSLIAELSDANLGFTTGMPTLVKSRAPDANGSFATPARNQWYLVFGSGPTSLTTLESNQSAKVYAYDLVGRNLVAVAGQPTNAASFFGDFAVADWNSDYMDDTVYVGTVEAGSTACTAPPCGRLKRITLTPTSANFGLGTTGTVTDFFVPNKPIVARPTLQRNLVSEDKWVMFGTGRLFTAVDNQTTQQQTFYGIKEPNPLATVAASNPVDVTGVQVSTLGDVFSATDGTLSYSGTDIKTFNELASYIATKSGWFRNLAVPTGKGSERNITEGLMLGSSLVYTTYIPSIDTCSAIGTGNLSAVSFTTGTAQPFSALGQNSAPTTINGKPDESIVSPTIDLGIGLPSAPRAVNKTVYIGDSGQITTKRINTGTGNLGRQSWRYVDIPFE